MKEEEEIKERKEIFEKDNKKLYKEMLDEQIQQKKQLLGKDKKKEKSQQVLNKYNDTIFQPKEEMDFPNVKQEGNYNYNFEEYISPV